MDIRFFVSICPLFTYQPNTESVFAAFLHTWLCENFYLKKKSKFYWLQLISNSSISLQYLLGYASEYRSNSLDNTAKIRCTVVEQKQSALQSLNLIGYVYNFWKYSEKKVATQIAPLCIFHWTAHHFFLVISKLIQGHFFPTFSACFQSSLFRLHCIQERWNTLPCLALFVYSALTVIVANKAKVYSNKHKNCMLLLYMNEQLFRV